MKSITFFIWTIKTRLKFKSFILILFKDNFLKNLNNNVDGKELAINIHKVNIERMELWMGYNRELFNDMSG